MFSAGNSHKPDPTSSLHWGPSGVIAQSCESRNCMKDRMLNSRCSAGAMVHFVVRNSELYGFRDWTSWSCMNQGPIKFLVRIRNRGLFPDDRSNAGPKKFDRPQHLLVRERRDTHLESNSRQASQNFVHVQDLLRDRFSIADQQGARGSPQSVKLCSSRWWPAAFFAALRERVSISGVEIVCSLLCGVSKKADCVKSDNEFLGRMAGAAPSFAVKVDQGTKSLGFSADNGDHQRKSECAGTNEGFGRAADSDPNRQRILERTRIDRLSRKGSAVLAFPVNMGVLANLK